MTTPRVRGPYAKGIERRAQILEAALAAYSVEGSPTLREVAAAVGLSEAGVLHYFGSREELFVAILEARDEQARDRFDLSTRDGVFAALEDVSRSPGLAKLYVDMSVAAADPGHPARAYMKQREAALIAVIAGLVPGASADDPRARSLVALAEGLQIQWLRDRSVDVPALVRSAFRALVPEA